IDNMSKTLFITILSVLFVASPSLILTGNDSNNQKNYQVVDLVTSSAGNITSCPDSFSEGSSDTTTCSVTGIIDKIHLEEGAGHSRLTLTLGSQDFYYLLRSDSHEDTVVPMDLFTTSKISRFPITLRFLNWGGEFYVTEASL